VRKPAKPIRVISSTTSDGVRRDVVSSASDARRRYIVTVSSPRKAKCSCPRWIFGVKTPTGRRRIDCKHILALRGVR
jgi:hypothetical protein